MRPRGRGCTNFGGRWSGRTATCCRGVVEVDETFVGGRSAGKKGASTDKVPVMVAVERLGPHRLGRVRFDLASAPGSLQLVQFAADTIEEGSVIHTDGARMLRRLGQMGYIHEYSNGYAAIDPAASGQYRPAPARRAHRRPLSINCTQADMQNACSSQTVRRSAARKRLRRRVAGPAGPAMGAMLESALECPPGPDALVRLATLDPAELEDRDAVLLLAAWERQLRWAAAHGQRILARLVRPGLITTATRPDQYSVFAAASNLREPWTTSSCQTGGASAGVPCCVVASSSAGRRSRVGPSRPRGRRLAAPACR